MALAGGRRIEHESRVYAWEVRVPGGDHDHGRLIARASREYEWVVRRRGNEFRLVIQDVAARGQLLVARFPVYVRHLLNESHGEYYTRTRNIPALLHRALDQALGSGWQPTVKGLPPLLLGSAGAWFNDARQFRLIDDLWTILDAICRDPQWRARLAANAAEFVPVPPEYVRGLDAELPGRLAEVGELVVYVRDSDHGDGIPHLAIRSLAWGHDLVLEDITEWHRGFR
jgi:hypothetical protein